MSLSRAAIDAAGASGGKQVTAATGDCVWIVVLNWNNGADTVACMEAIRTVADTAVAGVIVCDNASADDSAVRLRGWAQSTAVSWCEVGTSSEAASAPAAGQILARAKANAAGVVPFALLHTGANLGFAGGNNAGLRALMASGLPFDAVLVLNNDAWPVEHAVSAMARHLAADPRIGMCGPTVVFSADGQTVQARAGCSFNPWLARAQHLGEFSRLGDDPEPAAVESQLHYILGAAQMVSRRCLESVGLMYEGYFLYYEEIDWCLRARRAGWRLAYAADAVVMHKGGGTIGSHHVRAQRSLIAEYYLVRSALRFTRRLYPVCLPTVLAFHVAKTLREALARDWARVFVRVRALFSLGPGGPAAG